MSLPIHFFTIVLNGEPFIRYHLARMQALQCDWHWHIIEGLAELKHDTAWSLQYGAKLPTDTVKNGRSIDGTAEYLDQIARENPDRITLYRAPTPPNGRNWDGKLEMISAPLPNIPDDSLLWEVDSDELWTTEQFELLRRLFLENPERTAAVFFCWYFVGPTLAINRKRTYPEIQWRRAWRFKKGMRWVAHEPPVLAAPIPGSANLLDVAMQKPFTPTEMEKHGLVFQHYAYAIESQLDFKEKYYGYKGITNQWKQLQAYQDFPVRLRQFMNWPWVDPAAMVDPIEVCGIVPLAREEGGGGVWDLAPRPLPWTDAAPEERDFERDRYITGWKLGYHLLPRLIERFNLKVGAEVGVALGGHSSAILDRTGVERLYGIDSYQHRDDYEDVMNLPQARFDVLHQNVLRTMAKYGERFKLIRMDSAQAAAQVTEPLDFVYIDADHSYEGAKRDLEAWFPKVREGGIISGHDYASSTHPGVTRAVQEFLVAHGLAPRNDEEFFWWAQKGEPSRAPLPANSPWKRGILYIQRGITNALVERSLRSLAALHPELRVHVQRMHEGIAWDKRAILQCSPFEETLLLEADTVVLDRLDFGFDMARRHGMACCIAECPWARRSGGVKGDLVEYNAGVLFFTAQATAIFDTWAAMEGPLASIRLFDARSEKLAFTAVDHTRFSLAVAQSAAPPFILPANWNFRPQWQKTWWGPIKVWHDLSDPPPGVVAFTHSQAQPDAIIQYVAL